MRARKSTMVSLFMTTGSAALMGQTRGMVSLHSNTRSLSPRFRMRHDSTTTTGFVLPSEIPPSPTDLLNSQELDQCVDVLLDWWGGKSNILCLTGAGLSTESGITDYRGHRGSYHIGHRPMIHDQFMKSEANRRRYWGRGMVGWKSFDEMLPNKGHTAIAQLEQMGKLGVDFEDREEFYQDPAEWLFSSGHRRLALVTQNVDTLHRRAGSQNLIELHGRTDQLICMQCGSARHRSCFHKELIELNSSWLEEALRRTPRDQMRPDGDANVQIESYDDIQIPSCQQCDGFMKPDVVFFGDTVPRHRVETVKAAVTVADGLLVVGSSLAVHSAFRHVRAAVQLKIPVAILNVGPTRAEIEGLDVLKVEAPAGETLSRLAKALAKEG